MDVDITHTYIGDLQVVLRSPAGTEITLHDQSGSGTDNLQGNYPNSLTPAQSLDALTGQPLDGTWTLSVSDHEGNDDGTLNSWALHDIQGYSCDTGPCNMTVTIELPGAGDATVTCPGDTLQLDATVTQGTGSETYTWQVLSGAAQIQGATDQSSADILVSGDAEIACTVTGACQRSAQIQVASLHVDSDGDGATTITDLEMHAAVWTSTTGQPNFEPTQDYVPDGIIDVRDLTHLGTSCF